MPCPVSMSERAAALLHHFLGRSIDRAGCGRDRKFKPLVLGEIQAAGDNGNSLRIVAFNTAEGWSWDVSEDIALEILPAGLRRG
jgi:hypothetical protein